MDKILDSYNPPRINQEGTDNLNRLITSNEMEAVIKTFGTSWLAIEFFKTVKVEVIKNFQTIPKYQIGWNFAKIFYEASIMLILKAKIRHVKKTTNLYP